MQWRCLLLVPTLLQAAKIYKCSWPRSVLSSGDPNLTVTLTDGSDVRCDRTGDASFLCPAACDYVQSEPYQCVGPIEDGDVCNTVWGKSSLSYYKMTSFNDTHACTQRFNGDCTEDMGGVFCQELRTCYGSYQEVIFDQPTFLAKYGYEPSFLMQPFEILEAPSCWGLTGAECCMANINFFRCLHDAPPVIYHQGIAQSAQAWAEKPDKASIHSGWGGGFFPEYTEVLTWGTSSCTRGVNAWYQEIGVHNFSIPAVQNAGGSYNSGHMVILLWQNHSMVGCGFDNTLSAPITVCDFSWPHQGHKGPEAWEANLKPRSQTATQQTCREKAMQSTQFPMLAPGQDITSEQIALLLSWNGSAIANTSAPAADTSTTSEQSMATTSTSEQFSRTRARLGVRELRLVGAVTADPRKRSRALCDEAARVTMALQAHATSAAKDLLQIQGSELEAVILEVDRAASALVPENAAEMNTVEDADSGRTLHDWDSGGSMREVEVYAVVAGQLFLIGPAELQNLRWMMQMTDTEEQFAALQNARLYIADVSAEIQTSSGMKESGVLQRSNDSSFQVNPDLMSSSSSKNALEQGIRGQLLFCALEL
ncbi:unnamed protein product [Effrenium voratum]|uniref:SCP domain-containing protein n=1 Tax=Effrenium voratum TaxID=2562239 RepID=A0AA36HPN6_9DINO|nr:unnamed protein product [Effrenium voratum]